MVSLELLQLDTEIRKCTRCSAILGAHPENPPRVMQCVQPRPILSEPMRAPVMLVGQAPGLTEYQTGRPFSGQAGGGIRQVFAECGLAPADFDRIVYQTSAVKFFPGRRRNKMRWEDRAPCAEMRMSCTKFLERQIAAIQPTLIVTLGAMAAEVVDSIRLVRRRTLSIVLGTSEIWMGRVIIYLAHTSGGSRFLNDPKNRAKQDGGEIDPCIRAETDAGSALSLIAVFRCLFHPDCQTPLRGGRSASCGTLRGLIWPHRPELYWGSRT
jgi:uracil-DNA glycosylase family 4